MTVMPRPYLEFPKWVTPPGGDPRIVENAEEEAAVMGSSEVAPPQENPLGEKETLLREAERLGIPVDGRWGIERIRVALQPPAEG